MKLAALVALVVAAVMLTACGGTSSLSQSSGDIATDATAMALTQRAEQVRVLGRLQAQRATEAAERDAAIDATSTQQAIDARATVAQRAADATATELARPTATATSTPQPTATATPEPTMTSTATVEPSATVRVVVVTAMVERVAEERDAQPSNEGVVFAVVGGVICLSLILIVFAARSLIKWVTKIWK